MSDRIMCKTNPERRDGEEHCTAAGRADQSILKEIKPEHSREGLDEAEALAKRCEETVHWKRPRCWHRVEAKGEGLAADDSWIPRHTQWV